MATNYPPEVVDSAMKLWAQSGGTLGWSDIARRLNEIYGIKVAANTVKSWYQRGIPISWNEFLERYNARLYENQAKRLAEEAAEVREHTWIALRSMFKIIGKEIQKYAEGKIELKWRSADALFQTYLSVVKEYYRIFGDNDKEIQALLKSMPEEARRKLEEELGEVEQATVRGAPEA